MKTKESILSRRKFIGTAATAVAAVSFAPAIFSCKSSSPKKPNSKFGGVQLGCTTYSYGSMPDRSVSAIIDYLLIAGINTIELRSVAENALGIPHGPKRPGRNASDEEKAEYAKAAAAAREEQRKWRLSCPMSRYEDMRKQFNSAGIDIHIAKFAPSSWSDEEIDYAYNACKVLGAYGITDEYSEMACSRLSSFAEKHGSLAIFHNHTQPANPGFSFDKVLACSPSSRLNIDVGHYFGCTGKHPNEVIERYHDKICSIHIKDKTAPKDGKFGENRPYGEGDTPIADMLLLIKKKKYPINVDVELEHKIPEGSNAALEVAKCIDYMRNILE